MLKQYLATAICTRLEENNILTMEALRGFDIADLEKIDGIGPKALIEIFKGLQTYQDEINVAGNVAGATPVPQVEKYTDREPPKELATPSTKTFTIELQFRHAEWVERAAQAYGMTELQIVEQAVRQAYQRDPYKAGATAVSGSVLKHDNPHSNS